MTMREAYQELLDRMYLPENAIKKEKLESTESNGMDLKWHLNRAKESLDMLNTKLSDTSRKLCESDFRVSIGKAKELMDEQGWK